MAEEEHCSHSVDVQEYFDKVVAEVSRKWDHLGGKLGFNYNEISVVGNLKPDQDRRCREVLERWRNRNGREATLQVLKQALIDIDERLTAENLEGIKARKKKKRKRKRKGKQPPKEDSSEESHVSSMENDVHAGTAASHPYFSLVAKAVASCWVKFAEEQLGLTAQDIHGIQLRQPYSKQQQALQALELWRDRRGRKACRVKLAEALRRGGFQQTANELETYSYREVKITGLAETSTNGYDYVPDGKVSNGEKQRMIKKQRTDENGSGARHFNGKTENGSANKDAVSRSSQGHATSGSSLDSSEDDSLHERFRAGSDSFQRSNSSLKRKKRGKKTLQEKFPVKRKKQKKSDSKDTTDVDQNCLNGENLIKDSKTAIHNTFLKIHEKLFDKETVQNDGEFKRCMNSMKKIESVFSDTKDEHCKLQSAAKLTIKKRVNNKIAEVAENMFTDSVLDPDNRETFHKMAAGFKKYAASIKKAKRGCVLCYLDFPDVGCYDTFWRGYTDGSLSDTLTRELITDDMRAAEGGADLYIHVRVLYSATGDGDFSDQDPSGTSDRGPPHPGPSREHSGQGPPAPGNSNHGDDTPPGYHGNGTGGRQVSVGDDVIQVKQEPAEQVPSCSMVGTIKPEIDTFHPEMKGELAGPPKRDETELDRQFCAVADHLGSMWERLASSLGFNTDYIRDLTARLPPSLRPHQLICDWMERNLGHVTLDQLVQALRDAGIHEVADAVDSGKLFLTEAERETAKGKPDEDIDTGRADDAVDSGQLFGKGKPDEDIETNSPGGEESSRDRSPDDTDSETSGPESGGSHGNKEGETISEEDDRKSLDSGSHSSTVSPPMYPTGEDALAWNDCLQDFFKTDEDTTRVIQESWPGSLLVKHLIRDRFFHSYLCEYWKQYQTFPSSLATFVKFVTERSAKQFCYDNDVNEEHFKSVYENLCLVVGKAAFENHTNNISAYVYKGQLEWGDIQQSGFGWLEPVASSEAKDTFQFVHDSIRQFLMAMWVAHTVRTQTDGTELLRVCTEKSAHLPITCYCLAHLLGMVDSPPAHLLQFVTLLMQQEGGLNDFNHLLSVARILAESNRLDASIFSSTIIENLLPDKTLDLSALPEISLHSFHCLTQLIRSTTFIQRIRLPGNVTIQDVLKQYPFRQKPVSNVNHVKQVKYLSYLPLFECIPSTSRNKTSFITKCKFAKTDECIDVDTIHRYLQFAPSLQNVTVRSGIFFKGTLGNLSKSLLFTPNLTNVIIAVRDTSNEEVGKAMDILSCLRKLDNVQFTEYWSLGECHLSVRFATFTLKCKTRSSVWPEVLSFRPFDVQGMTVEGRHPNAKDISTRLLSSSAERLVFHFQCLKSLVELRFEFLRAIVPTWSLLFQGLESLPPDSTEAGTYPPLELLCCANCGLTSEVVQAILGQLQALQNLRELDLSHNDITDDAVHDLAEGIGFCQNLKHVGLKNNKISDKGALMLLLQDQCKRIQVETAGNNISGDLVSLLSTRRDASQIVKLSLMPGEYPPGTVPSLCITAVHLLLQFLPQLPNLQELALCVRCQGEEEAEHIDQFYEVQPTLKTLELTLKDCSSEKITRLLTLILQQFPLLEAIDLSGSDIRDEAVPALAQGLGLCQNLKKVNLSHNRLYNRGDFLPYLPNLEEIDLSYNNICDEAVPGLAEGLASCQKLKKVNLSFNSLSYRGDFLPPLPNLEEIDLSHNAISDEAAPGFAKSLGSSLPNLEEIDLSHNTIGDKSVPRLAEGLGSCQNLKHVNLTNNEISNKGALLLWLLKDQCKRMQVETAKNNISDNLVFLLSNREDASKDLEEIDLSHIVINDGAVPGLFQCLGSCQKLKRLNLSFNNLSDKGDFLPPLPNLEEIDLSHNALSDESVPTLVQGFGTCQNLKKVNLSHNNLYCTRNFLPPLPKLEEIDISHNAVRGEAVTGLAEGLGSCLELKKVNLSHNKLSDVVELIEAFTTLPLLTHININDNSLRDKSLPAIAAWLKVRTAVEVVNLYGNRFSAEGVRDFVRTMEGKAYNWLSDDLLYDGSQADVGDTVESSGADVRREEQQWERLWRQTDWTAIKVIPVTVRQLTIWINHRGPRSNNAQQMSPKAEFDECPALPICLKPS